MLTERPLCLRSGGDISIFGLGTLSHAVAEAAERLADRGIAADAWAIPSIRPLQTDILTESMKRTGTVITVEAHSVHGGLGSLVSELITGEGLPVRLKRLGIPEGQFAPASPRDAIERRFRLDADGIFSAAGELLNRG